MRAAPADRASASGPRLVLPAGATLASLVEQQVDRTPLATAVACGQAHLDYAGLDARANQLAHLLRRRGVGADVPVAVCADRSLELAVGLVAILKAGGACVPIDRAYPPARKALMLDDAAPPVLLAQDELAASLPPFAGEVVCFDADRGHVDAQPRTRPAPAAGPGHLAYVLYTSGSTGVPKGVALEHRGLVNHTLAVQRLYELTPADRVVQFCSLGFDVSVEELFPSWASGATVVFRPDDVPVLGAEWPAWLRRAGATVLNLPTAYWHAWVRDLRQHGQRVPDGVRLVIVGGEKALGSAYRTWLTVGGDRPRWINAYGPAETSVLATSYEPTADRPLPPGDDPPIGRPLANTYVRLLDARDRPVAEGEAGRLCIGGVGVARGYLNRPELTAQRFVADPFGDGPADRLYRTGDLARWRPDGELEFLGRADEQVKVRGFRVECGEVERALLRHAGVAEAAVVAREDTPGDRRLVAYVVAGSQAAPSATELRRELGEQLPAYMVPSAFVALPALPLTANGKTDRDALPAPGAAAGAATVAAPRTATERTVAEVWSSVLGVEGIGVDDDFFDLGGHSLQAIQAVAELRRRTDVPLSVRQFFEAPTVERLAAAIDDDVGDENGRPPLVPQPRAPEQPLPLTLSQQQMWQLETSADPPGLFNVTAMRWFDEPVDPAAVQQALDDVVDRHEALRAEFHTLGDAPCQTVRRRVDVPLSVVDVDASADGDVDADLHRLLADQDAAPFDPGRAPLLRACLYRLAPDRSVVAVTFDHLVCDGTSAYVFLTELAAATAARADGRPPSLRPLAVQYPDFALWQRQWATEEHQAAQLAYWKQVLSGAPRGPAVEPDRIPEKPTRRIRCRPLAVAPGRYRSLQRLARSRQTTVFAVVVAAVQALCGRVGGRDDVVLSTTLSGRQQPELEGLIGCFHGVGRIRTRLDGDPSFAEVVDRVREAILGLLEHQDIPFMRVRRALMPDFPPGGPQLLASVPIDFQYFHTAHDEWAPGAAVVERPGADKGPNELFFRGQLHPLSFTFLDDGAQLWGQVSYKTDFYDETTIDTLADGLDRVVQAVAEDPEVALSQLPASVSR